MSRRQNCSSATSAPRLLAAVVCGAVLLSLASVALAVSPASVFKEVDASLGSEGLNPTMRSVSESSPDADKTLAPYLHISGGADTERLPLKETSAEVEIAGVIAKVKVHQLFENTAAKPIEAIYVFPASTRAAVHGMRMKIGERVIEAKIERKAAAREQYDQAKREGKRASLLEQQRPNVFTMSVANLMPGDRIEVVLDYSELLVPEDSVYEFVYPTTVGPRYGGGADPKADQWIANPYLHQGEKEPYKFDVKAHVETGLSLKELASPSHAVDVRYASQSSADVALKEAGGGNRDFVLRYRLAGDAIETGMLLWQGETENFFVVMMEPPRRPTSAQIPTREYVFLVDVSGSMHGFPLETSKTLMRNLLGQLRETDLFNVVLFSGASQVLRSRGSATATREHLREAWDFIDAEQGGGGTELMAGLQTAYGIPRQDGVARSVIVVTDGYVGVEAQAFRFIHEHLNDANLFAFGIGSSVNRGLIESMARAGMGEPFVVLKPEAAEEQAQKLAEYVKTPVLTGINVRFDGFAAAEVAPMKVPDMLAQRPLVLFGKYSGAPRGAIEITGTTGEGRFSRRMEVSANDVRPKNSALRWLWARRWVALLDDEMALAQAKEIEDAITDLGLTYNLLTTFTSFVAVDSQVVNEGGAAATVKQPLPLPQGVEDTAVAVQTTSATTYRASTVSAAAPSGGSGGGAGAQAASCPTYAASPTTAAAGMEMSSYALEELVSVSVEERDNYRFALRMGASVPLGSLSGGAGQRMSSTFGPQGALVLDFNYRLVRGLTLGAYLGSALGSQGSATEALGNGRFAWSLRTGLQLQYHFELFEHLDPWLGYGIGYSWDMLRNTDAATRFSQTYRGWEFAHVLLGIDYQLSRMVTLGLFVDYGLGQYQHMSATQGDVTVTDAAITDKSLHHWLTLGPRLEIRL